MTQTPLSLLAVALTPGAALAGCQTDKDAVREAIDDNVDREDNAGTPEADND